MLEENLLATTPSVALQLQKCLPKNEFTSVVQDNANSDGVLTASSTVASSKKQERLDWCLRRAMAFYNWNQHLSHEVVENDDTKIGNEKKSGQDGAEGEKGKRDGSDYVVEEDSNHQQLSETNFVMSDRRATTLPLLRNSRAFFGSV